ncbi:hypothetical protein [Paracoccus saliphilus]|uniref:Uncharacterized protein n=1 Tax=Paracoccus saliphilus TaxID=405559 RepID=A0AA45W5S7_9RHOB|nr:hypothetical protein [Paracoccus saliphilus]WCR05619.1 hypothetical protein JHX88_21295 [Paracoccus saliphilus]SIS96388.1 hypothetical protein SAMN05421772_11076 [Paracoccus saliphilus]
MRTCYLHAGMPRTGSTSIQNALLSFKSDRIRYADLGQANHSAPLICSFSESPQDYHVYRNRGLTDKQIAEEVDRHMKAVNSAVLEDGDVIFSSEGIVDHLKPHEIKAMAKFLRDHSERVQVIIYVRPLASLAASQMQQRIIDGLKNFTIPAPQYRKRFQPFINQFGRKNVQFVRYSRDDLIGGNVVSDFAERVGVDEVRLSTPIRNDPWSVEAIGTLYAFNKFTAPQLDGRKKSEALHKLMQNLSGVTGRRFDLSRELIEQHIEKHRGAVEWAERVCGFDLRGTIKDVENPIRSEADLLGAAIPIEPQSPDASTPPQAHGNYPFERRIGFRLAHMARRLLRSR